MKTPIEIMRELQGNDILPVNIMDAIKLAQVDAYECGRAELSDITHLNYLATVHRGLITPGMAFPDFIDKMREETDELAESYNVRRVSCKLADITLVCFAMAEHYGIDLVDEMRKKTEFNEQRKD